MKKPVKTGDIVVVAVFSEDDLVPVSNYLEKGYEIISTANNSRFIAYILRKPE